MPRACCPGSTGKAEAGPGPGAAGLEDGSARPWGLWTESPPSLTPRAESTPSVYTRVNLRKGIHDTGDSPTTLSPLRSLNTPNQPGSTWVHLVLLPLSPGASFPPSSSRLPSAAFGAVGFTPQHGPSAIPSVKSPRTRPWCALSTWCDSFAPLYLQCLPYSRCLSGCPYPAPRILQWKRKAGSYLCHPDLAG